MPLAGCLCLGLLRRGASYSPYVTSDRVASLRNSCVFRGQLWESHKAQKIHTSLQQVISTLFLCSAAS